MTMLSYVIMVCLFHQHLAQMSGNVPLRNHLKMNSDYIVSASKQEALNFCADKCVMYGDCLSFSYGYLDRKCELYSEDSTTAASKLIEATNVVFIDIRHWPQGKMDVCGDKPCSGNDTQCVPDGQTFRCGKKEPDKLEKYCPPFPVPEHGRTLYENKEVLVGKYIYVGCIPPYLTTIVHWNLFWFIPCHEDGTWGGYTYTCFTVTELCIHTILADVNITVQSSFGDLVAADMLFSSPTGVTFVESDYLEIKFHDNAYWIGGLLTKGGSGSQWVTSYRIKYSTKNTCGETDFKYINTPDTTDPKVFPGNADANSEVKHMFVDPVAVSCFRIEPVSSNGDATMRVELLWCQGRME